MSLITNIMGPTITPLMGIKQAINWVAQLNGDGQYWQLSEPITVQPSDDFKLKLKAYRVEPSGGRFIFSSMSGGEYGINLYSTGDYSNGQGSIQVFGGTGMPIAGGLSSNNLLNIELSRLSGVWSLNVNGVTDSTTPTSTPTALSTSTASNIFSRVAGGFILSGYCKDFEFEVNNTLTNEIPLTNKAQGATQLATVGNVNATMIGYNENVWVKESDL